MDLFPIWAPRRAAGHGEERIPEFVSNDKELDELDSSCDA